MADEDDDDDRAVEAYDAALALAEQHLAAAEAAAGDADRYVAVAMLEASVNRAVDLAGHQDIIAILRDLADQIAEDFGGEAPN